MRSSYIDWLLDQKDRVDDIGYLAKWVVSEDFDPVEFPDIVERIKTNPLPDTMMGSGEDNSYNLRAIAYGSLVEYATILAENKSEVFIIDDTELNKEKLKNALRNEDYLEAARLRDEFNKPNE